MGVISWRTKEYLNISHLCVDVCSSCHLFLTPAFRPAVRGNQHDMIRTQRQTFRNKRHHIISPIAPLCIYPSTTWLPPLSRIPPRLRYMRPFFLFSFFSAVTLVVADHTERIDNQDKRITYSDGWKFVSSRVIQMEPNPSSPVAHSETFCH